MIALSKTFVDQGELITAQGAYTNELETVRLLHTLPAKKQQRFNELSLQLLDNLDEPQHKDNCAQRSRTLREQGNLLYKSKTSQSAADQSECVLSACRLYTRAILAAENAKEELCLGYANRGMALQDYGYYAQAYDDCACALEFGYPTKMQHKLIMRQAHCAWKLSNAVKLAEHICQLEKLQLNPSFSQQLEQLQQQVGLLQASQTKQQPKDAENMKAHSIKTDSSSRGRHMIAEERIRLNELIFTEQAECFVPIEQRLICQNCASSLMCAPIPCPECRQRVVYCSLRCRQLHKQTHSYECAAYRRDLLRMLGISHLAMRMVLTYLPLWLQQVSAASNAQEFWQTLMSKATEKEENSKTAPQWLQSLSMLTHLDKLPTAELAYHTLCANLLQVYLHKCTSFYAELLSDTAVSTEDWHMIIAALILRCTGQLLVNGHAGDVILPSGLAANEFALLQPKLWQRPFHLNLGCLHKFARSALTTAINLPYLSLCNHACAPSIRTIFDGHKVRNYAALDIDKDAEIFNCYTVDYRNSISAQRRQQLQSQYKFNCRCTKCARAQPDQDYLAFHRYRCESSQCAQIFVPKPLPNQSSLCWWLQTEQARICCTTCKADQEAAWYDLFLKQLESCHESQAREDLYKSFDALNTWLLDFHSLKLRLAQELIEACFAAKEDGCQLNATDYKQLASIIHFQLAGTAAQHGDTSSDYICRLTYLWDLIALGEYECSAQDMASMRRAIEYQACETKQIFVNYYNDFIEQLCK